MEMSNQQYKSMMNCTYSLIIVIYELIKNQVLIEKFKKKQ